VAKGGDALTAWRIARGLLAAFDACAMAWGRRERADLDPFTGRAWT